MAEFWAAVSAFFIEYQVPIRIIIIITVAVVAHWVLRRLLSRAINRVVTGVKKAEHVESTGELAVAPPVKARAVQRARALGGIGGSIITWVIAFVALAMVLGVLGFDLTALLASAGVLAAAIAFGAQNVVKDLFSGLFMAFEDQLGVGDLVTIGEVSGEVEDVGIRITKVRGIDGTLWFVRNGEILTLGNSSQGWGRALVDITVDGKSDIDEVERVAVEAAKEVTASADFARKVTGEPEMWGIESAFADRTTLRLAMRTRPVAQWSVQREMRAVIGKRFHEAGIDLATELPRFPGADG